VELYQSLEHTKWDCKYHIVWIPKYRKKAIYGSLRKYLGEVHSSVLAQVVTALKRQLGVNPSA